MTHGDGSPRMAPGPVLPDRAPGRGDDTRRRDWGRRLQSTRGGGKKLRRLGVLLRPYRGRTALMFVSLIAATVAGLAPGPLVGWAIDDGIKAGNESLLYVIVGLFVGSAVLVWLGTALQTYLVSWVGQRVLQDLRVQIFDHLQKLPVAFYERRRTGVLISRLTNDVEALDTLVSDAVVTLFQSTLTLLGAIVILFIADPSLALLTFTILPALMIGSVIFRIASADAYKRTRETIGALTAELQETLSGIRVVRAFGREDRHLDRFAELNDRNRDANMTTVHLNAAYFPAVEFASALATILVLAVGGVQVIHHAAGQEGLKVGVLVTFMVTLGNFFDPIQQLSQLYTTYQSGQAALDKIFELLDEPVELTDSDEAIDLPHVSGRLTLRGVSFRYGPETPWALRDVDVELEAGKTLALVGATGAGKSTLAKLLARFYDPSEGAVLIDGHDLRSVTQHSLRRQLGIVPQEPFLFSGTIGENLRFGAPDASDATILAALEAVGAKDFVLELPAGLEAEIGERGVQLSGGQRQLLAFARALLADPRTLILDEATAAVDPRSERQIEQALDTLMKGRTVVVIAHRLSTIRSADQIAVLEGGAIAERGTHEELVAAGGMYARLDESWRSQGVGSEGVAAAANGAAPAGVNGSGTAPADTSSGLGPAPAAG